MCKVSVSAVYHAESCPSRARYRKFDLAVGSWIHEFHQVIRDCGSNLYVGMRVVEMF